MVVLVNSISTSYMFAVASSPVVDESARVVVFHLIWEEFGFVYLVIYLLMFYSTYLCTTTIRCRAVCSVRYCNTIPLAFELVFLVFHLSFPFLLLLLLLLYLLSWYIIIAKYNIIIISRPEQTKRLFIVIVQRCFYEWMDHDQNSYHQLSIINHHHHRFSSSSWIITMHDTTTTTTSIGSAESSLLLLLLWAESKTTGYNI